VRVGINGRLDTLQAAHRYSALLDNDFFPVIPPRVPENRTSVWAQYSVLARDEKHRSDLQCRLKEADIPTAIYYPKPLHLQTAFSYLGYKEGDFPISEDCASKIFSLPMHPYLQKKDQELIAEKIGSK